MYLLLTVKAPRSSRSQKKQLEGSNTIKPECTVQVKSVEPKRVVDKSTRYQYNQRIVCSVLGTQVRVTRGFLIAFQKNLMNKIKMHHVN
jgi:hypothetical protein